jgi:hypothetical protein
MASGHGGIVVVLDYVAIQTIRFGAVIVRVGR